MDKMYERRMALAKLIGMTNGAVSEINSKLNQEMNGGTLAIEGFTRDEFLNRVMNADKIPSSGANVGGGTTPPTPGDQPSVPPIPDGGPIIVTSDVVEALKGVQTALNRIADIMKVAFVDREIAGEEPTVDPTLDTKWSPGLESTCQFPKE